MCGARFLYTDELTVNSDNAQDLLELSGHYQLYTPTCPSHVLHCIAHVGRTTNN
jgi:hypothetical protein